VLIYPFFVNKPAGGGAAALHNWSPVAQVAGCRLLGGQCGIAAVALVHRHWSVLAILMTGGVVPERLAEAKRSIYWLLHKP
jgi:hypothetical protein